MKLGMRSKKFSSLSQTQHKVTTSIILHADIGKLNVYSFCKHVRIRTYKNIIWIYKRWENRHGAVLLHLSFCCCCYTPAVHWDLQKCLINLFVLRVFFFVCLFCFSPQNHRVRLYWKVNKKGRFEKVQVISDSSQSDKGCCVNSLVNHHLFFFFFTLGL